MSPIELSWTAKNVSLLDFLSVAITGHIRDNPSHSTSLPPSRSSAPYPVSPLYPPHIHHAALYMLQLQLYAPSPLASPYPPYVCYTSPGSTTVPALFPPWLPYLSTTSSLRPFLPLSTHPAISSQHLLLCKTVLTVTYTLYQVLMISAAKLSDDNSLGLGKKQQLQQLPCWRCRRPPPPLHNPQAFSPPT